jgi:hypothetical protein
LIIIQRHDLQHYLGAQKLALECGFFRYAGLWGIVSMCKHTMVMQFSVTWSTCPTAAAGFCWLHNTLMRSAVLATLQCRINWVLPR